MKSFNLKILVFFLTVVALNGCVSTSKMTKVIRDRMPNVAQPTYDYSSFVTVKSDSLIHTDSLVTVKKEKSYFIPAVFLWAWNHQLACELSSNYMLNIFRKVLADKLKEYNMEKFIGNNKLEINIKKVPNRFKYTNNGSVLFLVFAYSYHFQEVVYRENERFVLTYTFPILNKLLNASGTFWLYGFICLSGFLFIFRKLPETKGKSLEEIEKM